MSKELVQSIQANRTTLIFCLLIQKQQPKVCVDRVLHITSRNNYKPRKNEPKHEVFDSQAKIDESKINYN